MFVCVSVCVDIYVNGNTRTVARAHAIGTYVQIYRFEKCRQNRHIDKGASRQRQKTLVPDWGLEGEGAKSSVLVRSATC